MSFQIRVASRKRAKLRVGIFGASGSGKTFSALKMAYGITKDWTAITVVDSERGSGELYSELGPYNVLNFTPPYTPERYIEAIAAAEKVAEVVIVDSISHEWMGKGGCLEIAEKTNERNDFAKWKHVTPRHNAFIDRILSSSAHVICCGRSKEEYALSENDKGRLVPKKMGLKAITRDGFDYEMTVCFDLDFHHQAMASKDRTSLFDGKPPFIIDTEDGSRLINWMNEGSEAIVEEQEPEQAKEFEKPDESMEFLKNKIREVIQTKELSKEEIQIATGVSGLKEINDYSKLAEIFNIVVSMQKGA